MTTLRDNNHIRLDRVPPCNIDAEVGVLGACLIPSTSAMITAKAYSIIGERHVFYKEAHEKIWGAILALFDRNAIVDRLSVADQLEKEGVLEKIGGDAYLSLLVDAVPFANNIEAYCEMVVECYKRREIIMASMIAYNDAFDDTMESDEIMSKSESVLLNIRSGVQTGFANIKKLLGQAIDEAQLSLRGLDTGYPDLDKMILGLQNDYIIVAGRPSMGKSIFVTNIAQHVAKENPVGIFTLEMSASSLIKRMLSTESSVIHRKIRAGEVEDEEISALVMGASRIYESNLVIDETSGLNERELRVRIMRMIHQHKVKLVVIDYLQLMTCSKRVESRQLEVTEISRAIKGMVKDFNIPIIVVCQLSRAPESRSKSDKRPQLSDLRESGSLEQDGDLVILLYRDDYYDSQSDRKGIIEAIIAKQRNGETGMVELAYQPQFTRIKSLAKGTIDNGK